MFECLPVKPHIHHFLAKGRDFGPINGLEAFCCVLRHITFTPTLGENTNTGGQAEMVLAMPIRQSDNEAVDIVTDLIHNIITDIL